MRICSGRVRTAGAGVEQLRDGAECCRGAAGKALFTFLHILTITLLFVLPTQIQFEFLPSVHTDGKSTLSFCTHLITPQLIFNHHSYSFMFSHFKGAVGHSRRRRKSFIPGGCQKLIIWASLLVFGLNINNHLYTNPQCQYLMTVRRNNRLSLLPAAPLTTITTPLIFSLQPPIQLCSLQEHNFVLLCSWNDKTVCKPSRFFSKISKH